jgi:hypothetical protein
MEILEHHDEGAVGGKGREQATGGREQGRGALRLGSQSDRYGDVGRDLLSVVVGRQQPMQPAPSEETGRLDHRVSHREERDTFAGSRTP